MTSRRVVRDVKFRTSRITSAPATLTANGPQSPREDNSFTPKTGSSEGLSEQLVQTTRNQAQRMEEEHREVSEWTGYLDKGAVLSNGGSRMLDKDAKSDGFSTNRVRCFFQFHYLWWRKNGANAKKNLTWN